MNDNNLVLNSPEYWAMRYASGDWENRGGNLQQTSFAQSLVHEIPQEIKDKINGLSICDVNCAFGYSLDVFKKSFPDSEMFGIDFVAEATDEASKRFPQFSFNNELIDKYDCLISSNSLEHIREYKDVLKDYIKHSNKFVILMIPYNEDIGDGIGEHVVSFNENSFSDKIDKFKKVFFKEFNCEWWMGEQMIVIYENSQ